MSTCCSENCELFPNCSKLVSHSSGRPPERLTTLNKFRNAICSYICLTGFVLLFAIGFAIGPVCSSLLAYSRQRRGLGGPGRTRLGFHPFRPGLGWRCRRGWGWGERYTVHSPWSLIFYLIISPYKFTSIILP